MPIDEILSCSWLFVVLERKADFALTCVQQKIFSPFYFTPKIYLKYAEKLEIHSYRLISFEDNWNAGEEWNSTKPYYFMIKLWIQCTGMSNWTPQIALWFLPSAVSACVSVFLYSHKKLLYKDVLVKSFSLLLTSFFRCIYIFLIAKHPLWKISLKSYDLRVRVPFAYHLTILIASSSLTKTQISNYFVKLYFEYLK